MSQNSIQKRFLRAIGRNMVFMVRWISRKIPDRAYKFFASGLIAIASPLINRQKHLAVENLQRAFGSEKSEKEIHTIAENCFKNICSGMIELIYYLDRPKKNVEMVSIEGQENLDKALAAGHGAILLSAHFGNFILMYMRMVLAGYKVNCIMRRVRDEEFEKYISKFRNENGIQTIYSLPHRQCVVNSIKRLRDNEVLFILLDQNYGDVGGVYVDFFGQPAATATGPVVFSERTGAPILPIFILGNGKGRYKIKIEKPVEFDPSIKGEQAVLQNVAVLTKIIEGYIRRYPTEWVGWLHRRWKSKLAGT
jgi:KDO2-lipid IV(A) lauroyltransferase